MTWIENTSVVQTGRLSSLRRKVPNESALRQSEGSGCPAQTCRQRHRLEGHSGILVDGSEKRVLSEPPRFPVATCLRTTRWQALAAKAEACAVGLHVRRIGVSPCFNECAGALVWQDPCDEDPLEMISSEAVKYSGVFSSFRLGKSMKGDILRRLKQIDRIERDAHQEEAGRKI